MMVSVKISGGKDVERALKAIEGEALRRNSAIRGLSAAAQPMKARAVSLAPQDTHLLKESIDIAARANFGRKTKRGGSGGADGTQVEVFIGVDDVAAQADKTLPARAIIQELGRAGNPVSAYMRGAYESMRLSFARTVTTFIAADVGKTIARQQKRKKSVK